MRNTPEVPLSHDQTVSAISIARAYRYIDNLAQATVVLTFPIEITPVEAHDRIDALIERGICHKLGNNKGAALEDFHNAQRLAVGTGDRERELSAMVEEAYLLRDKYLLEKDMSAKDNLNKLRAEMRNSVREKERDLKSHAFIKQKILTTLLYLDDKTAVENAADSATHTLERIRDAHFEPEDVEAQSLEAQAKQLMGVVYLRSLSNEKLVHTAAYDTAINRLVEAYTTFKNLGDRRAAVSVAKDLSSAYPRESNEARTWLMQAEAAQAGWPTA